MFDFVNIPDNELYISSDDNVALINNMKEQILQLCKIADYYMDFYKDAHAIDWLGNPDSEDKERFNNDDAFVNEMREGCNAETDSSD